MEREKEQGRPEKIVLQKYSASFLMSVFFFREFDEGYQATMEFVGEDGDTGFEREKIGGKTFRLGMEKRDL